MSNKNILILFGGGGTEHEISQISVKNIIDCLSSITDIQLLPIEINKEGKWVNNRNEYFALDWEKHLVNLTRKEKVKIDFVIPCIHGYPGETGDLQSYFEMIHLPYMGSGPEASKIGFNKISTKLWAEKLGIPTTPSIFITSLQESHVRNALEFFEQQKEVVVKASNQGSSVGCYLVTKKEELKGYLELAFKHSPFVLIEKRLKPREIEVSVYEWEGKNIVSYPGEIVCPSQFYSYEEKYSKDSKTYTLTKAPNLSDEVIQLIQDYALKLFQGIKLKHLARVDFFLDQGKIYLNEVNTFPGLTPISMFPKMMESQDHSFAHYLRQILKEKLKNTGI